MPRAVSNARYAATQDFQISDSAFDTQTAPIIAALSGGGFVAVWNDFTVRAQIYDRNGREVGAEFSVGQSGGNEPTVAALPTGGFVVSWTIATPYPDVVDIRGQIFDAAGGPVGAEFSVNTTTAGFQVQPHVTAVSGGGFVMVWNQRNDGTFDNIRGQLFAADGAKIRHRTDSALPVEFSTLHRDLPNSTLRPAGCIECCDSTRSV